MFPVKKRIKNHYHWVVAAVLFLQLGIYVGFYNVGGSFLLPITLELGISRSAYSVVVTFVGGIVSCLTLMVSGSLFQRFGYRKMLCIGMPCVIAGYSLMAFVNGLPGLVLSSVLQGIAVGLCTSVTANRVINTWFCRHRGTVWGVLASVTGLGGSLWSAILPSLIGQLGWRNVYLSMAGILVAILALNLLLVCNEPADMGMLPYGEGEHSETHKAAATKVLNYQGCSFKELVRKPVFYLLLVALTGLFICIYLPYSVIVAHGSDRGLSAEEASDLQSIMLLVLAGGKILFGWLVDRIGVRKVLMLCCVLGASGLYMLAAMTGHTQAVVAVVLYGLSLPVLTIVVPALTIDLFGYHSSAVAIGIFASLTPVGSMLAGPISNSVFDAVGNYAPAFYAGAGVLLGIMAVLLGIYAMANREKKKWLNTHSE